MNLNRRSFMRTAIGLSCCAAVPSRAGSKPAKPAVDQLDQAALAPILKLDSMTSAVRIASIELLRDQKNYYVRTGPPMGRRGSLSQTAGRNTCIPCSSSL